MRERERQRDRYAGNDLTWMGGGEQCEVREARERVGLGCGGSCGFGKTDRMAVLYHPPAMKLLL